MSDHENPTGGYDDSNQGNEHAKPHGSPDGINRTPNDASSNHGQQSPGTHPKPAIGVRFWRALWRKRIFWHPRSDRPPANWAEKVMACVTIALLIVGGIQAYIYWKQSRSMELSLIQTQQSIALNMGQVAIAGRNSTTAQDTLTEMKNGGTDTHTLAEAAKKQAANTNKLAIAANTANSIAEDAFEVQSRPWIGIVTPIVIENQQLKPPNQIIFDALYKLKNYGPSPASRVIPKMHIRITGNSNPKEWNSETYWKDVDKYFLDSDSQSYAVFPSEESSAIKSEVEPISIHAAWQLKVWLVGCIGYQYRGKTKIHHSQFLYLANYKSDEIKFNITGWPESYREVAGFSLINSKSD